MLFLIILRLATKKNESVKKIVSDYNFYDPDWKMKEIIENASSDLAKNDNFLPRIQFMLSNILINFCYPVFIFLPV